VAVTARIHRGAHVAEPGGADRTAVVDRGVAVTGERHDADGGVIAGGVDDVDRAAVGDAGVAGERQRRRAGRRTVRIDVDPALVVHGRVAVRRGDRAVGAVARRVVLRGDDQARVGDAGGAAFAGRSGG